MSSNHVTRDEVEAQGEAPAGQQVRVVVGALLALVVGAASVTGFTQGLFLGPVTAEFHWTKGQFFAGFAIAGLVDAAAMPLFAILADRLGTRRVLLAGIVVYSAVLMSLATLTGSFLQFMLLNALLGAAMTVQTPLLYAKAISSVVGLRRRGLAFAVAFSGFSVGGGVIPLLVAYLMREVGWRGAYVALGVLVSAVALPAVFFLMPRKPPERRSTTGLAAAPGAAPRAAKVAPMAGDGISLFGAFRDRIFWMLLVAVTLQVIAIQGGFLNLPPLLAKHGFSPMHIAAALSVGGITQVLGRLLMGVSLDRSKSARIAIVFFVCGAAGLWLILTATAVAQVMAGAVLVGVAIGSEMEMSAYFTSRFFGKADYGRIFGVILACFTIGGSAAPLVIGLLSQAHGYPIAIGAAIGGLAVGVVLLIAMGSYRFGGKHA